MQQGRFWDLNTIERGALLWGTVKGLLVIIINSSTPKDNSDTHLIFGKVTRWMHCLPQGLGKRDTSCAQGGHRKGHSAKHRSVVRMLHGFMYCASNGVCCRCRGTRSVQWKRHVCNCNASHQCCPMRASRRFAVHYERLCASDRGP